MITVLFLCGAVFSLCCLSVSVLSLYYLNYSTISSERDKKILLLLTFNPGLALTTQARLNTKYYFNNNDNDNNNNNNNNNHDDDDDDDNDSDNKSKYRQDTMNTTKISQ